MYLVWFLTSGPSSDATLGQQDSSTSTCFLCNHNLPDFASELRSLPCVNVKWLDSGANSGSASNNGTHTFSALILKVLVSCLSAVQPA